MLSNSTWNSFKGLVNKFSKSANKEIITWKRWTDTTVALFNEDKSENDYTDINLQCLIGYNEFRTWPMTRHSREGNLDDQNMLLILNRDYLNGLGYLNQYGQFDFDSEKDEFLHRGVIYKAEGDTLMAQASDEPVLFYIVLRREEVKTSQSKFNQQ